MFVYLPAAALLLLPFPPAGHAVENEDCMMCHADADMAPMVDAALFEASVHGGFSCTDCHMDIEEIPHEDELEPVDCSFCHDEVVEVYEESVHGMAHDSGDADAAECASCHGVHDIRPSSDPLSRVHHHNLAETCIQCHEDQALIEEHELPSGEKIQSYVFSVHGQSNVGDPESKAATCNNCHGWHDIKATKNPEARVNRRNVARVCGDCHEDVLDVYYDSVHGRLAKEGNPDVSVCTDCHGEHQIRSPEDRESLVSKFHIAETCARCHEDQGIVEKYDIPISTPATFYRESVHGQALLSGENEDAAACHDCHGYHSILGGHDPDSMVNRMQTPETCGGCHRHDDILDEYERSIHGEALRKGIREAPVCTDCHGEHTILSHLDPDSPVYPIRLAKEVCGRCHDSLVLNRKYDLPEAQVATYFESYHGLASRLGDTTVANCASCHGAHLILPSTNPESTVSHDNLMKTCGACHPGVSPKFVAGIVHISPKNGGNSILVWVRRIYIALIFVTIGGMLLHNFLIVGRHIRDKYRRQKQEPYVVRFSRFILVQHLVLSIAFILLVLTGFALKFPDSLFSEVLADYVGLGEGVRAVVHRVAGVALILTGLSHAIYMTLTRAGRKELGALMLSFTDVKKVFQNIGYHLALTEKPPKFDRFDYTEKMEYWALIWGTIVMVVTGLIMWFPEQAASWFGMGKIWVDVSTVIHYYEAWLATLAIIVWHFFFVLFHPEEYPMAMSWLTGKLSVRSMEERHPLELDRLEKEGKIHAPDETESRKSRADQPGEA
jgi:cytochrome b subunit of formate dehydrogenase/nitrate/TMAO reductase-like tetraheme cytochrome c subunit